MSDELKIASILKWAGGKRNIMSEIIARLPKTCSGKYFEPFVGGGSVFFAVGTRFKNAEISDMNSDLIAVFKSVKETPSELLKLLEEHKKKHSLEHYYAVREKEETEQIKIAARFIYLNKTCFNGLWRVNGKGKFNVPMGRYENPNIADKENIELGSEALKTAEVFLRDYSKIEPKKGDFVYLDPPYDPINKTSFTKYTKLDFKDSDQTSLRDFLKELDKKGVKWMLSNSNTPFIQELYKDFNVEVISVSRFIGSKVSSRKKVEEVIVRNYSE